MSTDNVVKILDDRDELFLFDKVAFVKHLFDQGNVDLTFFGVDLFGSNAVVKLRIEAFGLIHFGLDALLR
jgi:hypothetical protein